MILLKELFKTSKKKIVNIATNKAIITVAIFFYLVLILIKSKEKNYGEVIENGNNAINILKSVAPFIPIIAGAAVGAVTGGVSGAAGAGEEQNKAVEAVKGAVGGAATGALTGGLGTAAQGAKVADTAAKTANAADTAAKTAKAADTAAKTAKTADAVAKTAKAAETVKTGSDTFDKIKKGERVYRMAKDTYDNAKGAMDSAKEKAKEDSSRLDMNMDQPAKTDLDIKEEKAKKGPLRLVVIIVSAALIGILGLVMLMYTMVNPISLIVEGVGGGNGSSIYTTVGEKVGGFLERIKNTIFFGSFETDEQVLYEKIKEKYKQYMTGEHAIELDLPLLAATLFYDAQNIYGVDKNGDGLPDVDERLTQRIQHIDELVSYMISLNEIKFLCTKEVQDEIVTYKKVFVSSYPANENEKNSSSVCSEETVGLHVYEHRYEVDLDKYYKQLVESDILVKIFGQEIIDTQTKKESIAGEILAYRDLWVMLYGEIDGKEECPSSGTIPMEVLSQMQAPVLAPYNIISYYGYRTGRFEGFHKGIDVVPTEVVNIYAAGDGIVSKVWTEDNGGNVVMISHNFNDKKYYTLYGHMANNSITVVEGQPVIKGDVIGIMGDTGVTSGAHLHFQMGRETLDDLINPVNLFDGASNYIYECRKTFTGDDCTLEGSIASIAQQKGYNFNIIRAIVDYESSSDRSDILKLGFKAEDLEKRVRDALDKNQAAIVASNIDFNELMVVINGSWTSFKSSGAQNARHEVVRLVASINEEVYKDVAMGNGQIKGSNYSTLGYSSAKEMFEDFSKSKYAQINGMIRYLEAQGSNVINVLKNIENMADSELFNAVTILVKAYRPGGPDAWVAGVLSNYRKFRDDPNSKIETFIGQCGFSVPDVGWGCHFKVSRYCNPSQAVKNFVNNLKNSTSLSERQRSVLEPALSLWLKVNYCGHDKSKYYYCKRGSGEYARIGINPNWQYDSNGLDCGDYVTWVLNQAFKTTKTGYVLGTACISNTSYTTVNRFGHISSVASNLQPGDGICDTKRNEDGSGAHVMIYLGYEDKNGNGIGPDDNDLLYFIHSSDGSNGVIVTSSTLSKLGNITSTFTYTK